MRLNPNNNPGEVDVVRRRPVLAASSAGNALWTATAIAAATRFFTTSPGQNTRSVAIAAFTLICATTISPRMPAGWTISTDAPKPERNNHRKRARRSGPASQRANTPASSAAIGKLSR